MQLFNSTNFEQQGNTENDIQLNNNDEICESIIQLSSNALKSIKIFTPDLEHHLYNNDNVRKILLDFTRGNRHAQIQILAADTDSAIRQGHQLIRLAQQITSSMQIRITPEEYQNENMSFLLIDQSHFIFKSDITKSKAISSNCKQRANKLLDFFTLTWEQATQDLKTKRIRI